MWGRLLHSDGETGGKVQATLIDGQGAIKRLSGKDLAAQQPKFGQSARFNANPQCLHVSAWADSGAHAVVEGHLLYSPA
jgi:hypothetical protein